jgi:hypothetical protein
MGVCIDERITERFHWKKDQLKVPIPIQMANGSVSQDNKVKYTTDKIVEVGGVRAQFNMLITRLSKPRIFLGYDWLKAMNPAIDWTSGEITWRVEHTGKEKPRERPEPDEKPQDRPGHQQEKPREGPE